MQPCSPLKKSPKGFHGALLPRSCLANARRCSLWHPYYHPDLTRPFILEADTLEMGVGAVLLQRFGEKPKIHPVGFFSRKHSLPEHNYNIGNQELLTLKLALEKWRDWLESAARPFIVLTDHKNLEYLHTAKCLNPCQVRLSLYFTHFNFTVIQSKDAKAESLSHMFPIQNPQSGPKPILLYYCCIHAITWDFDRQTASMRPHHLPAACPPSLTYVSPWPQGVAHNVGSHHASYWTSRHPLGSRSSPC